MAHGDVSIDEVLTNYVISPDFQKNPYAFYKRVLERPGYTAPSGQRVFGRYADVEEILLSPERFPQEPGASFHNKNTPDHTRLRLAAAPILSPKAMMQFRDRITEISTQLIDAFADRGAGDLMTEYALLLPGIVIADLLGAPVEHRPMWMEWLGPMFQMAGRETLKVEVRSAAGTHAAEGYDVTNIMMSQREYFAELLQNAGPDSNGALKVLNQAVARGKMTEQEALETMVLLLAAGLHTTVNQLGNTMLLLLQNPDQLELLRRTRNISGAIEEGLRLESSAQAEYREVTAETTIGGVQVRPGEQLMILFSAANRDPSMFPNPEQFDITRENARRHIAFGRGIHLCLGAPLARAEMEIGITHLLDRLPNLSLSGAPALTPHWRHRGLASLPVAWDAL